MDVKKSRLLGRHEVYTHGGTKVGSNPVELALQFENLGVGEILLNSIDRDGTMKVMTLP